MDDEVRVKCPRCKGVFRERARRITSGYSRQCSGCEAVLFFDEGSSKREIRDAMSTARQIRRALREQDATKTATVEPFVFKR
jgi:predicted  nucleic acid-binding Zn-ribbon protein